jgi:hypothetical protein
MLRHVGDFGKNKRIIRLGIGHPVHPTFISTHSLPNSPLAPFIACAACSFTHPSVLLPHPSGSFHRTGGSASSTPRHPPQPGVSLLLAALPPGGPLPAPLPPRGVELARIPSARLEAEACAGGPAGGAERAQGARRRRAQGGAARARAGAGRVAHGGPTEIFDIFFNIANGDFLYCRNLFSMLQTLLFDVAMDQ